MDLISIRAGDLRFDSSPTQMANPKMGMKLLLPKVAVWGRLVHVADCPRAARGRGIGLQSTNVYGA
jgi:hypothetical protein